MAARRFRVCDTRMSKRTGKEPQRMRQLAKQLRDNARTTDLRNYAEKLLETADELERRATEIEDLGLKAR